MMSPDMGGTKRITLIHEWSDAETTAKVESSDTRDGNRCGLQLSLQNLGRFLFACGKIRMV
jgi:hypothetical protein